MYVRPAKIWLKRILPTLWIYNTYPPVFGNSRYFHENHWNLGSWWIWPFFFVQTYEIYLEISFTAPLVFKSFFLHFIMKSVKKIRIESHKNMTFLICLLWKAIKPSPNYRKCTFSGYSLNIFVYNLEHIMSQDSLTFSKRELQSKHQHSDSWN